MNVPTKWGPYTPDPFEEAIRAHCLGSQNTVEARKLEHECPPTPKRREEGKPASIILGPHSNCLESTVGRGSVCVSIPGFSRAAFRPQFVFQFPA